MENASTVRSRLLEYLKYKKVTQTEFTRSLGVSSTYIGAMRKGMPASKLKKVMELYPDLNRDWLLYGEGEMLNPPQDGKPVRMADQYETLLLPVEAFAGDLQMWSQGVRREDCDIIISPVKGVDFALRLKGDSMEPRFHDGTILLVKRINERAFIPWGHPMVIDTENGVLVKNLYPSDSGETEGTDNVIAKSLNPAYPPFEIPTSSIYGLYRVMGTMDIYSTL